MRSLRGQLLVAGPALLDPNFHRTVVLLGEHGEDGAMGLVLNRLSDVTVADAVPPVAELVADGELVHVGGPVQPQAVVVLAEDCVPPGKAGQLSYAPNGQKPEPYKTVLMTAPRSNLTSIAKRADSMETMLTLKTTTPDPDAPHPLQSRPQVASEGIGPK